MAYNDPSLASTTRCTRQPDTGKHSKLLRQFAKAPKASTTLSNHRESQPQDTVVATALGMLRSDAAENATSMQNDGLSDSQHTVITSEATHTDTHTHTHTRTSF